MRWVVAIVLSLLATAAHAQALRDLSTDRPDKTESPYTVDAGHWQVELDGATYTIDRTRGTRTETLNILPTNLKYGLSHDTDVQVIFDSYLHQTVTDRITGARDMRHGVGDLTVRLKHNFWGDDGGPTAFALMPFVKLPTNSAGLGNNAVEGGIIAPLAFALSERVGLGVMTEIDLNRRDAGSGYAASFVNSATLSRDFGRRIGGYVELYTERSAERGSDWIVTADTGVTYAVSKDTQLDLGVNVGATRAADDLNLFVGFSRRF